MTSYNYTANDLCTDYLSFSNYAFNLGFDLNITFKVTDRSRFTSAGYLEKVDRWKESRFFLGRRSDYLIVINGSHEKIYAYCRDAKALDQFIEDFQGAINTYDESTPHAHYYTEQNYNYIDIDPNKFGRIIDSLYPNIDIDVLLKDYQMSDESILFLYGPPGVGKTTFLKYMMQKSGMRSFAYIKDEAVMKNSEVWSRLSANEYDAVIFDDLDFAMEKRSGQHADGGSNFVSNLLSYSDGLFNQDAKIVITTNQKASELDNALLRPGRCFDVLHLDPLSRDQALKCWIEDLQMSDELFAELFGESEQVTQAELMSHYKRLSQSRRLRGYIKDGTSMEDRIEKAGVKGGMGFTT